MSLGLFLQPENGELALRCPREFLHMSRLLILRSGAESFVIQLFSQDDGVRVDSIPAPPERLVRLI